MNAFAHAQFEDTRRSVRDARQYITFDAAGEQFAIDITSVREIKGWTSVTSLPNQPDWVRGVLNLRGAVIPIIDLARRLGGAMTEASERHVVVIAELDRRLVGLLVDAVSDILSASSDDIRAVPDVGARDGGGLFQGFLTEGEQMIAMLDLARIVSAAFSPDQNDNQDA